MKLVDILARELKEWPENQDFAWQDQNREIRFNCQTKHDFYVRELAEDHVRQLSEGNPRAGVTRSQWQAAVDALKAGEQAWDGTGNPPVGTECEFKTTQGNVDREFEKVRIQYLSEVTLVVLRLEPKNGIETEIICHPATAKFRSVRTAQHLAEEVREKEIMAMVDARKPKDEDLRLIYDHCSVLHDAGYRVQQIQPARKGGSNERPAD